MNNETTSSTLTSALTLTNWQKANHKLLAKIITEFLYEELISTQIEPLGDDLYQHTLYVTTKNKYTFTAYPRIFGNWSINEESIEYFENNLKIDSLLVHDFITRTYKKSGISKLTLGHLLRELNHTLLADCHILEKNDNLNETLLSLPRHSLLEGYMYGHPWFVINKGRIGFSYSEYLNYAPERQNLQNLSWIAVAKTNANFNAIHELDYEHLIKCELAESDISKFHSLLADKNLNTDNYFLMPIHEWQWMRQIIQLFPDDIANQQIIYLGTSSDKYLATQSIRSFNNQDHLHKYQVKLPISIFNTAVYRGLPNQRTELAPTLSQWIKETQAQDKFLSVDNRLIMLGEIASINYSHKIYNNINGVPYQYQELLGVIWRENIHNALLPNEKALTMASLIHIDQAGIPFISTLIQKSGLSIEKWLSKFFDVCIPPILHWLYKYGTVFSAHGENTMLIINEEYHPTGLVLKDFIDDVNITTHSIPELSNLPPELKDTLYQLPDHELLQFIYTGLFVVLYRYLSDILHTHHEYKEASFWGLVNKTIDKYHNAHPELEERIKRFDIFKPSFKKLTLNKLRLIHVGYADYASRPKVESTSIMDNPINDSILQKWHLNKNIIQKDNL